MVKQIHSTDWILDWTNALLMAVHFWMANQYVIDLKKNVERWMLQKLEKWGICQKAPSGYINDKNTNSVIVDEEEADLIKLAFKMRVQWSQYNEIAQELYNRWMKSKTGKVLWHSSVESMISNKFYMWIMKFSWSLYKWTYPTFISKSLWESANWLKKSYAPRSDEKRAQFPFKPIIHNKHNWKSLVAYVQKWHIYYKSHWDEKSDRVSINQKIIVDSFGEKIHEYKLHPEMDQYIMDWLREYYKDLFEENKKIRKSLQSKITKLSEKKQNLLDLVIDWTIEKEKFKDETNKCKLETKSIEEELSKITEADSTFLSEANRTVQLLRNIDVMRKKADYEWRIDLIKIIAVQLFVDNKKQLYLQEKELFEYIKVFNMFKWQPHLESNQARRIWNPEF